MPFQSRWTTDIPDVSLPTFVFGSADGALEDRLAYADAARADTHFLTLTDFRDWSKRVAVGLQKAGIQPGDRVLLFSGNNIFFPVLVMGVLMAGAVFTGANPTYVPRELAHQLKDSGAKLLLSTNASLEVALEAAELVGFAREKVFVFDDDVLDQSGKSRLGLKNWSSLIATQEETKGFMWKEPASPKDTICCLNYSSGTTGVAKGVMITHTNHVANAQQLLYMGPLHPDYEEKVKREKWLCMLPMFHAYGQAYFVAIAPVKGIPVYIMSKFDFIGMLEAVQKFRITRFLLVPPIAVALAKHPASRKYDLSSIEEVGSGAAPLSQAIGDEVASIWKDKEIIVFQGWGMTETTCSALTWDPTVRKRSAGVGELNPNCEGCVMNEDGTQEVSPGEPGELWVRGPNIMKGYWKNESATKNTLTPEGWLKTGDIAYRDEDGIFYIVDRRKELIKVKGLQVAPAELEAVLLENPQVADAGVVGVTINGDEMPRGYVAMQQGQKISEKELQDWVAKRVSRHKWLTGGIVFVDAIPKNPSGKILRNQLRDRAKKEVGDADVKTSRL